MSIRLMRVVLMFPGNFVPDDPELFFELGVVEVVILILNFFSS